MCFTSVENFVNFGPQRPMNDTIEKFWIFTIKVIVAPLTSRSSENMKNFEKSKLVNLRYLGYITDKFHEIISVAKSTQIRAMLKLVIFCCSLRQIFTVNT